MKKSRYTYAHKGMAAESVFLFQGLSCFLIAALQLAFNVFSAKNQSFTIDLPIAYANIRV